MLNKMNEFVDHLNNVMEKPDNYSYDFSTRGSKYFKVHMNSHGSRSKVLVVLYWTRIVTLTLIGVVAGYIKYLEMYIV